MISNAGASQSENILVLTSTGGPGAPGAPPACLTSAVRWVPMTSSAINILQHAFFELANWQDWATQPVTSAPPRNRHSWRIAA